MKRTHWQAPQYWMRAPTIEIYPMVRNEDDSCSIHNRFDHGEREPDFFDVVVRYYGGDPLEEVEDLNTYEEACQAARNLQSIYRHSQIEDITA